MKSGEEIVSMLEKQHKLALPCEPRDFLVEAINYAIDEAYLAGQNRVMELIRKKNEKQ